MRVQAKVWRYVQGGASAPHVGRVLRANGRWNRPGVCGCLYIACTEQGARAEFERALSRFAVAPGAPRPRDLGSIKVDLDPGIDLTDPETSPVPPETPLLTGERPVDIERCRALADALRAAGYAGILTPSAAAPGEKNLVIYIDGPARGIRLDDGGDRIPLE